MAEQNKQRKHPLNNITRGLDILVMVGFSMGVIVVIALFVYVLSTEFTASP